MDTKAIEELIAIMDKAELTALRVDDGETKIELERSHGPLPSSALPLMADRVSALLAGKTESHEAAALEDVFRLAEAVGAAQQGLYFRRQHVQVEGFCDEVVRAHVHGHDDVHFLRRARDEHDRDL